MNYHANRHYFLAGCLAIVCLWSSAFGQDDHSRVLATVNGKPVTEAELALASEDIGGAIADLSPEERRRVLLKTIIDNQLLADAAEEAKIGVGSQFEAKLNHARRKALRDEFFERRILVEVTEADAKRLYDEQAATYSPGEEIRARHILVGSESEAKKLRAQFVRSRDFAKLAQQHSKDIGSNASGGDVGYFVKGVMDDQFEAAAFALAKGAISQPVKTQHGWHLIYIEDRRMRPVPTFEDMRSGILALLIQRKTQDIVAGLREKAKVEIVDPGLK